MTWSPRGAATAGVWIALALAVGASPRSGSAVLATSPSPQATAIPDVLAAVPSDASTADASASGRPGPLEIATALRAARETFEAGDPNSALARIEPLQLGLLADHVWLLRARWLHSLGRLDAALDAAQAALAADPPSEVRAHAFQTLARIRLDRGELADAYRAQEQSWKTSRDRSRSAELRLELAEAFEQRELPGDALQLYRKTWQAGPVGDVTGRAFARSRALTDATGAEPPSTDTLTAYARRLKAAYRCSEALPILDGLIERLGASSRRARALASERARCLFDTRQYDAAAAAYTRILERSPKDLGVAIQRARSLGRAGQTTRAVAELESIARRAGGVQRARCRYLIAILVDDDDPARARRLLLRLEKQRAAPGYARLARWRLAWADYLDGKYASALRRLEPLARGSLWDIEVQRARYWIAVGKIHMNDASGPAELGEIADKLPLSYYGILAAERLGRRPEIERAVVGEARARDEASRRALRARTLLEAGMPEAAAEELESWIRERRLDRHQRLEAAELFHTLGDHFAAVRLVINGFGGTLDQGVDPDWSDAWRHAWPRPFSLSVRSAVQEFDFDPALVYAIMREESTYRPEVASPAGALGLMQIIPPTASKIADQLGIGGFEPGVLLEPEVNIRFGTFYLSQLLERFEGERPFAIAAYNAGPEAVSRWLSAGRALRDDTFVDSVPYGETRRYCRRVLRSYRVYKLLYAGDADAPPTTEAEPLPEHDSTPAPPADAHVMPAVPAP